jgi:protein tyrosine/serine phosphatase
VINRFLNRDERYARRMARIARWDRPIDGSAGRLRAWAHMALVDHGVFRFLYLNRHQVSANLWRSAQPAPHQLSWFRDRGVRTVINLRGGREHGSWQLQKEACDALGLELIDFVVRSREAPDRDTILAAKALFERLRYPAVIHCKSGADRAGFVAALYLVLHEGKSVSEALRQLSFRYGHFRFAKTGILDAFFDRYRTEGEPQGLTLLEWVERSYEPEALMRDFRPRFWSDLVVDRIMRRE